MSDDKNIQDIHEMQIAPYAPPRAEIREMMERFKAGLTNADKLNDNELRALATAALGHVLNPWNQEIWAIPGKGLMLGIKGLRKVADRQAEKGGFRWWTEFLDIRSKEEARQYDVPDGAIAAKLCVLRRSDNIEAYLGNLKDLQASGLPYEAAMQLIGNPPKYVGVGYVMPNEKSEMPIPQRVMKRAEAHAIKQAFSVPFRNEYNVDLEPIEEMPGITDDWDKHPEWDEGTITIDSDTEIVQDARETRQDNPSATDPAQGGQPQAETPTDAENAPYTPEQIVAKMPPLTKALSAMDGKELFLVQTWGPLYLKAAGTMAKPATKHFENRWKSRFSVKTIREIGYSLADFLAMMADDYAPPAGPDVGDGDNMPMSG